MKSLSFLTFCLFLSLRIFAQHTHTISFDDAFPLSGHSHYSSLRVIDARPDKSNIGYLTKATHDRLIITQKPLAEELSLYFSEVLNASKDTAGDGQLLLVLYDLMLEDKSGNNQLKTLLFEGDFYGVRDSKYTFLGSIDTLIIIKNMMLGKRGFVERSIVEIHGIIGKYAQRKGKMFVPLCSDTDIMRRREDEKQNFEIYRAGTIPKKGIYYTPQQFLKNEPVDTPFVITEAAPGEMLVYYKNIEKDKRGPIVKSRTYFAAYDGKVLVASVVDAPFDSRMELRNGEYMLTRHCVKSGNGASQDFVAGMGAMYGLAGGLIAAALGPGDYVCYESRFDPHKKVLVPVRKYLAPDE